MDDERPEQAEDATLFPKSAGERLREAREAQGLSLAEIAARTRIPIRQLEAIENSDYGQIPSTTYAIGFARAYARAVGVDEVAIAREVRGQNDQQVQRPTYQAYEISDPAREPSRGVAMGAAVIALIVLLAVGIWFGTNWFRGSGTTEVPGASPISQTVPQAVPSATAPAPAAGQVVLTATDDLWLKVYDAAGKVLLEKTMKAGERYDVPADANGPMINVGRPDKLQITVGGKAIPPLGDGSRPLKDVPIGAAALAARLSSAPAAAPAPAAVPTVAATPRPASRPPPRATETPERPGAAAPAATLNIAVPPPATGNTAP